jgi:hypothetical protein
MVADHERFLIRTDDGPTPGTRVVDDPSWLWPLPEVLTLPDGSGVYVKVCESQLGPQPRDAHVIRGAQYEWRPAVVAPGEAAASE